MAWLTPEAYCGLWTFITKHDLVGRVRCTHMPLDDPAPALFQEPRLLHAQTTEGLWLRLTEVTGALETRGYTSAGRLIIEVEGDDVAAWNNGVFAIETDGVTTQVQANAAPPDIRLDIRALAMLYSGLHTARKLANWGLLHGAESGINLADQLFHTRFAPHCPDHF